MFRHPFAAALIVCCMACPPLTAQSLRPEWQWSVPVKSVISSETSDHPRAFLWIPPNCRNVRGVVVGQHNMEEEAIFEYPRFRKGMADLGFAIVWVTPAWDLFFRFDKGADKAFDEMMNALASESGYPELATSPVAPLGHSAAASYPWNFAALRPERTLSVVSVSGQWPYYVDQNTPDWAGRKVDGIPGLVSMGEYEAAESRAGVGLKQRADHPKTALSMLSNPGGGHFESSDEKVDYIVLYLKMAAQYRLPSHGEPKALKLIDPTKQGWLADRWHRDKGPDAPAAPVGKYQGDPKNAFWYFDEGHARATEKFQAQYRGKKDQLAAFVQDGKIVEPDPNLHERVRLRFLPLDDGISFKVTGTFLDTALKGSWVPEGTQVGHANGSVRLVRSNGPVMQTAPDTWSIRFDRVGTNNTKRSNAICLMAIHPGDENYRRTVQQSVLNFPLKNTEGADQTITFPEIKDRNVGSAPLTLSATSSSGLPVRFYVREGPAVLDGNILKLTPIPPRAKFPVKVTVVAWQWGRSIEPGLKSAEPVERSFLIFK